MKKISSLQNTEIKFWAGAVWKDSCLEWQKALKENGYGQVKWKGQNRSVHRLAWELVNGPIPEGMQVCHNCDNRKCINPEHLFLGTHLENIKNKIAKGRHKGEAFRRFGARNVLAKLQPQQVLEIRSKFAAGVKQGQLAKDYGVTRFTIRQIVNKVTWTDARSFEGC